MTDPERIGKGCWALMKCSQYLYGRSESQGYAMNKYSSDRPVVPALALQITRAKGAGWFPRVLEYLRVQGRTLLSNAEMVSTRDVWNPDTEQWEEVPDRPYAYTQYIFPHTEGFASQAKAFQKCLELFTCAPLLLDKHTYQREVEDSSAGMSERMLTAIPDEEVERAYCLAASEAEARRQADAQAAPEGFDRNTAGQTAHFSADKMGLLLVEAWRRAYRYAALKEADQPLLLMVTAPWRLEQGLADEKTLLHEGVVFLHDEVAPHLPDGLADILNVTFVGSGFGVRGCEIGAIMVCEPDNALYQDENAVLFCPFEDAIYGLRPKREELVLAQALMKGMPETYRALDKDPAASNYDIALCIAEMDEAFTRPLSEGRALNCAANLLWLQEQLARESRLTAEQQRKCMVPLEKKYLAACAALRVDFSEKLYETWLKLMRNAEMEPELHSAYAAMMASALVSGHLKALTLLNREDRREDRELEAALLGEVRELTEDQQAYVLNRARTLLRVDRKGELAEAYCALFERNAAAGIVGPFAPCVRMTDKRREDLASGAITPEGLAWTVKKDAETLNAVGVSPKEQVIRALNWYAEAKRDPELSSAAQKVLSGVMPEYRGEQNVLDAYVASGWIDAQTDEAIAEEYQRGGAYRFLLGEGDAEAAICRAEAFLKEPARRAKYGKAMGQGLITAAREFPGAQAAWVGLMLRWPAEDKDRTDAAMHVLARSPDFQIGADARQRLLTQFSPKAKENLGRLVVLRACANLSAEQRMGTPSAALLGLVTRGCNELGLPAWNEGTREELISWTKQRLNEQTSFQTERADELRELCRTLNLGSDGMRHFEQETTALMERTLRQALTSSAFGPATAESFLRAFGMQCAALGVSLTEGPIHQLVAEWADGQMEFVPAGAGWTLSELLRTQYQVEMRRPPVPQPAPDIQPTVQRPASPVYPVRQNERMPAQGGGNVHQGKKQGREGKQAKVNWKHVLGWDIKEPSNLFSCEENHWALLCEKLTDLPAGTPDGDSLRAYLSHLPQLTRGFREKMPRLKDLDEEKLAEQNPMLRFLLDQEKADQAARPGKGRRE